MDFRELGRWRGTDPSSHSQTEIDIMGEQDKDSALFAKCWFTKGCIEKAGEMGNVTLTAYHNILELLLTNHLSFPDALS